MSTEPGSDPIRDDEILFRRLARVYYDPEKSDKPSPVGFRPTDEDLTGLSLSRQKYISAKDVAEYGSLGKNYYVAAIKVSELRNYGIDVIQKPIAGNPGHAEVPGLRLENRSTNDAKEWQNMIAENLCFDILGPYPGKRVETG